MAEQATGQQPTQSTVKLPTAPRPNQHNESSVVRIAGDASIPRDFLTKGDELEAAGVLSNFLDENEVRNVIRLASKLYKFNVQRGIDDLRRYLNFKRAVHHMATVYALQGHTGIISPEALDVPLSKHATEELKTLQKQQREKEKAQQQAPG
jgi:hypothetical protein